MQNQLLPTCNKVSAKLTHYRIFVYIDFKKNHAESAACLSLAAKSYKTAATCRQTWVRSRRAGRRRGVVYGSNHRIALRQRSPLHSGRTKTNF